jgi:hypothetical protein
MGRLPAQVDNPQRGAIYPVVLAMPAAAPGLNLALLPKEALPAAAQPRSAGFALCARAAAWQRRPAGVLCVERLEVSVLPVHGKLLVFLCWCHLRCVWDVVHDIRNKHS